MLCNCGRRGNNYVWVLVRCIHVAMGYNRRGLQCNWLYCHLSYRILSPNLWTQPPEAQITTCGRSLIYYTIKYPSQLWIRSTKWLEHIVQTIVLPPHADIIIDLILHPYVGFDTTKTAFGCDGILSAKHMPSSITIDSSYLDITGMLSREYTIGTTII